MPLETAMAAIWIRACANAHQYGPPNVKKNKGFLIAC